MVVTPVRRTEMTAPLRRPGISREIPIAVTNWPDEATRTANSACVWIAEATVEGRTAPRERGMAPPASWWGSLSPPGSPDRTMGIQYYHGLARTMTYRSVSLPRPAATSARAASAEIIVASSPPWLYRVK
jgi:hypothetical protein